MRREGSSGGVNAMCRNQRRGRGSREGRSSTRCWHEGSQEYLLRMARVEAINTE